MNIDAREMARDTCLVSAYPFGLYVARGSRVLCSDGRVRALARVAATADTFFSVPAAVKVNGRTVSGYVTCDVLDEDESATALFIAYTYGRNSDALPAGRFHTADELARERELVALLATIAAAGAVERAR